MEEREQGGIPLQWKHKYPCGNSLSCDWCTQEKERQTTEIVLAGVFPGPSLSDLQKMQYESSFHELILNPVRFNVWQENKQDFFPHPGAVRPHLGFSGL